MIEDKIKTRNSTYLRLVVISTFIIGILALLAWIIDMAYPRAQSDRWKSEYPRLYTNAGYQKLEQTAPHKANFSEDELTSKITNQFGIRDDILNLILNTFPESETQSTIAAIKMAQYFQAQIGVNDPDKVNFLANKAAAALSCVNLPMLKEHQFIKDFDMLLRNTPARLAEEERIEHLLNGRIISNDYGINTSSHTERCNHLLGEPL